MSEPVNKPAYFDDSDVEKGRLFAILAYVFPILFFLPFVTGNKTQYSMMHANQALLLLIADLISFALSFVLVGLIFFLICLVYTILGIVSACNGTTDPFPLIGDKIVLLK